MSSEQILVKPAKGYEKSMGSYAGSSTEIELTCDCHPHLWGGRAKRTGLTFVEGWPVYELNGTVHLEYRGRLLALAPDGFKAIES